MEQPSGVAVYGRPGTVVIQTVNPAVVQFRSPSTRPTVLHHRKLHMIFGIIQMVIGVPCFLLDLVSVSIITTYRQLGVGIYCGVFFFVPGLLGFLAGKRNSTCCVVACMIMNIIGSCMAIVGANLASLELIFHNLGNYSANYDSFIYGKTIFVLCACTFEFFFTILHACLTCASYCYCCMPRVRVTHSHEVTPASVQSHPATSLPQQQCVISYPPPPPPPPPYSVHQESEKVCSSEQPTTQAYGNSGFIRDPSDRAVPPSYSQIA